MLKSCGKHVCRQVCAKSVRTVLEAYSQYLISQGHSFQWRRRCVRVVEHFGQWLGRRRVSTSLVRQFLDQGATVLTAP